LPAPLEKQPFFGCFFVFAIAILSSHAI